MQAEPKTFFYLIGAPGSGKTTVLNAALSGLSFKSLGAPIPYIVYEANGGGGVQLGKISGMYSGTDAMSMSIQPEVVKWLADTPHNAIVAEGDRLANHGFFTAVQNAG